MTTAQAEGLLNQHRADFLTAAQHEIRTPVTSIVGGLKLLRNRADQLRPEDREELINVALRATDRLERFAEGLADLDGGRERTSDGDKLGLLGAHYTNGEEISLDDPSRGNRGD